jgi:hypothetical protein
MFLSRFVVVGGAASHGRRWYGDGAAGDNNDGTRGRRMCY